MVRLLVAVLAVGASVALPAGPASAAVTASVTPRTGLVDEQEVEVRAEGFAPTASVAVIQCTSQVTAQDQSWCDWETLVYVGADDDGAMATSFEVTGHLITERGVFDCEAADCVIGIGNTSDLSQGTLVRIGFADSGPPPPMPSVHVEPASGLVDGQVVSVTGSGYPANSTVELYQCVAGRRPDFGGCEFGSSVRRPVESDGTFEAVFEVEGWIRGPGAPVDCAREVGSCLLSAQGATRFGPATASLGFSDSGPPPPTPTVTVTPSEGLSDGQEVRVQGTGWTPNSYLSVVQCEAGAPVEYYYEGCFNQAGPSIEIDDSGTFDVTLQVYGFIPTFRGLVACGSAPGACEVLAIAFPSYFVQSASAPLTFDDAGTAPPSASVTVEPASGLRDRQQVTVTGSGAVPGYAYVVQCAGDAPTAGGAACDQSQVSYANVAEDGSFTATMQVRRIIDTADGRRVDCSAGFGTCAMAVSTGVSVLGSAPIGFTEPGGYRLVGADGGVFGYGDAEFAGSLGGQPLGEPVLGLVPTPAGLPGYWIATEGGQVLPFGWAPRVGAPYAILEGTRFVALAASPFGRGVWLATDDGTIVPFGEVPGLPKPPGPLAAPIVGMAATSTGGGAWLVGADGGVFAVGDAAFHGSAAGQPLQAPIVGIAATPSGHGYWLVAADGGVFAYGDAPFHGSAGGLPLVEPVVGMAPNGFGGYWLAASDGGVFAYGDANFVGSAGGVDLAAPIVGITPVSSGDPFSAFAALHRT